MLPESVIAIKIAGARLAKATKLAALIRKEGITADLVAGHFGEECWRAACIGAKIPLSRYPSVETRALVVELLRQMERA